MIPLEPDKIPMPFAYEGGRNEILESGGETTGEASYAQGFPPITQQLLSQGGIPPSRKDFNGILYILSAYAFFAQSGGVYAYDTTVDYVKNCVITHGDQLYICLANNGPGTSAGAVEPGTNAAYWSTLLAYLLGAADDIGGATNPIYIKDGAFAASDATVGSGTKPVYLNKGTITASGSTVGSGTKPIYMSGGTLTASGSTVGSSTRPVYFSSGAVTQTGDTLDVSITGNAATSTKLGTATVGSGTKPIYLSSGTPTASSSTVGSSTRPVYLNAGTITQTGTSLAVDITGNAATSTKLGTATVGSGTKPIYLSSGSPIASGSTVGSGTKPIYMSSGTLTASGSTVGDENTPVYLKSGTITKCATSLSSGFDLRNPTLTPLIDWSKTTSHGTSSALGMKYIGDGNITLTDSFLNYDALVVLGGNDSCNHVAYCIWYKWQLETAAYAGTCFTIWQNGSCVWSVACLNRSSSPSSTTKLIDIDENCVIFEIYGVTFD